MISNTFRQIKGLHDIDIEFAIADTRKGNGQRYGRILSVRVSYYTFDNRNPS